MRRAVSVATLAVLLSIVSIAQTPMTQGMQNAPARKSPLADYAGSWIGTFDGHAWLTIRLTLTGDQISGTVQRQNDVKFTDHGDIKSVGEEQLTGSVENATLNGDGLLLTVKENAAEGSNAQQPTRYLLRLTSANAGEVKMVAMPMPPGMPKPKPWKVSRVTPNAVTPTR